MYLHCYMTFTVLVCCKTHQKAKLKTAEDDFFEPFTNTEIRVKLQPGLGYNAVVQL